MIKESYLRLPLSTAGLTLALVITGMMIQAQSNTQALITHPEVQSIPNMGQQITPLAPQGSRFESLNPGLSDKNAPWLSDWEAGFAVTTVVSPDHKTLLVLTSGYNRVNTIAPSAPFPFNIPDSYEYVFIYDISTPTPVKKQVVRVLNTYHGIVFDPFGKAFYVSGGPSDNLHIFALSPATSSAPEAWVEAAGSAIDLVHIDPKTNKRQGVGLDIAPNGAQAINSSVGVGPCAAGVAVSKDGQTMVVVNYYNDSISVLKGGLGKWALATQNLDLRPGKQATAPQPGVPGGEYPFWAVLKGSGSDVTAFVSSIRDREIAVVDLSGAGIVSDRIHVKGQPNKMTMNIAQTLLYVAEDQSDTIDVIDTSTHAILETIPVVASILPSTISHFKGANPNSVTLSPDEKQLYVTNGNLNCISVVALGTNGGSSKVLGLIPTGWYPNSVSLVNFVGTNNLKTVYAYVVNAKSPTGANPEWCYGGYGPPNSPTCSLMNKYNPQLLKAGFQSFALPDTAQLATLTAQVATNNRFSSIVSTDDAKIMDAVQKGIQHVIFIIKENRTYDQILGDLEIGNGDPGLTMFGETVTPNQHNLARAFVTLDNFLDSAEVSYDGWLWTTSAQAPDVVQHQWPVAYSYRGLSLDADGVSRNVNVAIKDHADRKAADPFTSDDVDVLPGQTFVGAPDGPDNEINTGYVWDAARRAGLTVRNYGFFIDTTRYSTTDNAIPVVRYPAATGTIVATPANVTLAPFTDPYFRGFDNSLPDYYRYKEWEREFDAMPPRRGRQVSAARQADGTLAARTTTHPTLPALSLVRFMHDHTGNWTSPPIDGVDTPETQVADNDYAVGLLIEKISKSEYANNTLIFVIEDDAQDGGDHVDSHRSIAFVAGAYVKQGALISTPYNTINFLRTIEMALGLLPMNLNDALARPMTDIFDTNALFVTRQPSPWSFTAVPSPYLYKTKLPLPPQPTSLIVPRSTHNVKYWAGVTQGMDFTTEDRLDPVGYNRILWKGIMGNKPYPAATTGLDLRQNRAEFLARYRQSLKQRTAQAALKAPAQAIIHAKKTGTD